jgi:hypothetical protein
MDRPKPPSISPLDLYGGVGTAAAAVVIDVRRGASFAADNRMIVGAIRRDPETVQSWRPGDRHFDLRAYRRGFNMEAIGTPGQVEL